MASDLFLSPITLLGLVGYFALDLATHLASGKSNETGRRVLAISIIYAVSAHALSILYSETSSLVPSPLFDGPVLTAVWIVSLALVLTGARYSTS